MTTTAMTPDPVLPRVTIRYCTQCKWMLRAAYYAQELLSTFCSSAPAALGEVALQPATGGVFTVDISAAVGATTQHRRLWDRKVDGGFPETKELKRRVRDVVEPGRDLGHVDGHRSAKVQDGGEGHKVEHGGSDTATDGAQAGKQGSVDAEGKACEDCA